MTFITNATHSISSTNNTTTSNIGGSNTLSAEATAGDVTLSITDSSMFPTSGTVKIENEYITFTSNSGTVLSGCVRGSFDSSDTTHVISTTVIGVYIGTSELTIHPDAMISIKSNKVGTMYLDFSDDNALWNTFPVNGFQTIVNNHEFHTFVKGFRYFRIRWENLDTTATTYFRINTYFGMFQQGNEPVNQSITDSSDSKIVKAVGVGYTPDGNYNISKADGLGFSTSVLLGNGVTYTSGVLNLIGYTQVQTHILSDKNGTILIKFASDSSGADIVRQLTIPYTGGSGFKMFSAPAFSSYITYDFTCDEVGQTDFYFDTKFTTKSISGQILGLEDFISPSMVANLGRNITVGTDPTGVFINQKLDGVVFKTEVPLSGGATYTSSVISTLGYSQIETHLYSNVSGSLVGTWYNDESKTTILRTFTRPYAGNEVGSVSYFSSPVFGPYLVYVYTNDGVAQTTFFLDLHTRIKAISGQVLGISDFIPSSVVANLGRNVIVGQDATGTFRNTNVDYNGNLDITISDPLSGFGDLRMVELTPQVQIQFSYNINSDIVNTSVSNGGTVTEAESMAILASSTATNGSAQLESIRQIKYRPGLGALARFSTIFTTGVAGAVQLSGVGDEEDGFFFGYNGTSFGINTRKNSVDTWVSQTAWSEDTMDGSGPSGMTLNHTFLNIYAIEYQGGQIIFRLEDNLIGKIINVHKVKYANLFTSPSTFNPTFPMHMDIIKTSGNTDVIMKTASMSGFVEGKSIQDQLIHFRELLHTLLKHISFIFKIYQPIYQKKIVSHVFLLLLVQLMIPMD
jgi:hypothetical protein